MVFESPNLSFNMPYHVSFLVELIGDFENTKNLQLCGFSNFMQTLKELFNAIGAESCFLIFYFIYYRWLSLNQTSLTSKVKVQVFLTFHTLQVPTEDECTNDFAMANQYLDFKIQQC